MKEDDEGGRRKRMMNHVTQTADVKRGRRERGRKLTSGHTRPAADVIHQPPDAAGGV